jgi:membrane protein YqaA with SNARE-associated domain
MERFADWLQSTALALGAPGLFVIAFLDSSFLSLPEINDVLLVWMVTQHKERFVLYATAATLGSLAGCLTLYFLGRKGGEGFVRRRFKGTTVDRAISTVQRYGVIAVVIMSLLPPPAPFKAFVLLSGVAGITAGKFASAILIGRGMRYFGEGALAVRYGDQTIEFLHAHGRTVSLSLVAVCVIGLGGWIPYSRRRAAPAR